MSPSKLPLLALSVFLAFTGLACAAQTLDDAASSEAQPSRRAPDDVLSGQPTHGEVVRTHPPTTHVAESLAPQSEESAPTKPRPTGRVHFVRIEDGAFVPNEVTVDLGDTVQFTWVTGGTHGVTSGFDCMADGTFESGEHGSGHVWTVTFLRTGFFPYFSGPQCDVMQGLLVVRNP